MEIDPSAGSRRRAIISLVIVNAIWGSSFPLVKCLNLQIDQHFGVDELTASTWLRSAAAAWMIGIRFGLAFLMFAIFFRGVMRSVRTPHFWSGVVIGVFFFLGMLFQVMGLATIPASRSGFLTSLAVVFTPLITTLLQRRLPRTSSLLGAAVALLGVTVLTGLLEVSSGQLSLAEDALSHWTWGDSLTTLAAFFFSCQILAVDRLGKRYDSLAFTPSMFFTTAVLSAIVFAVIQPQIPEASSGGWIGLTAQSRFFLIIVVLCIFPSLLAFAWMNKYQPRVSAVQAAVIYTMEPVFASSWAMFLPALLGPICMVSYANEQFSLPMVVGGSLVLAANFLALWPEKS